MGTDRRLRRTNRSTRAPLLLLPSLLLAGLWLTLTPSVTNAQVPALGSPVIQCNDMANVGATTTTCVVTITNKITYNADGTSTTDSVIETTVNGVANSTRSTSPITEISQCNGSGRGGASTVTCTSTITNIITGAPASAAARSTINQCNPALAVTTTCTATPAGPNATGGYQAIGQCNDSGATGTVTCTATAGAATDSSPAATIDQCNESATTGASTLTCTATLSNTFTCAGTTTTLANGACFAATTTTVGATTPTTRATSPTTVGSPPTTRVPSSGSGGTTTPTSTPAPGGGSSGPDTSGGEGSGGDTSGGTTETSMDSSSRTSRLGEAVRFTAEVQGPGPTPTGSVTFFDGSTELGTVSLIAGRAILWTSDLTVGEHDITARFDGPGGSTSTSAVTIQTVTDEATSSGDTRGPIQTTLARTGSAPMAKLALGLVLLVGGFTVERALSTRGKSARAAPAPDTY